MSKRKPREQELFMSEIMEKTCRKRRYSRIDKCYSGNTKEGENYYSLACTEHARMFYNKNDRYLDYLKLYEKILTNI